MIGPPPCTTPALRIYGEANREGSFAIGARDRSQRELDRCVRNGCLCEKRLSRRLVSPPPLRCRLVTPELQWQSRGTLTPPCKMDPQCTCMTCLTGRGALLTVRV